jgi:hypothetical protein
MRYQTISNRSKNPANIGLQGFLFLALVKKLQNPPNRGA